MVDRIAPLLLAAWLLPGLFGAAPAPATAPAAPRKPNIVVILTDDLGINDLSCYGRKDQPTPHLDKLASEGMRFTSAYCAQSICSASRAALMTGQAPARLHLTTFLPGRPDAPSQMLLHPPIAPFLPMNAPTIAERLKPAGYATGIMGKWHLGDGAGHQPTDRGFDFYHRGQPNTKPSDAEGGKGEYDLTAHAKAFITNHKAEPFFLLLAHNTPHIPLAAKPELIEKHKNAFNPVYAAMMETLDETVGDLLAHLESLGLADNTMVIFTSDNGGLHVMESAHSPSTHNTPFRAGKGFCYEGGLRIPLIVRWPDHVKPGVVVNDPVLLTDLSPTWLEMAGAEPAKQSDGSSLLPLLTGAGEAPRRTFFWHFPHYTNQGSRPAGAAREGAWMLVEHYDTGAAELFNLDDDPGEAADLSMKHPDRTAALGGKLAEWRKQVGAQENAPNGDFRYDLWRELYASPNPSLFPRLATSAAMREREAEWRGLMNAVLPPTPRSPKKEPLAPGPAGLILLSASEADVHGKTLRYEPDPRKNTLGYWFEPTDWASWTVEAPEAGEYEVEILQGAGKGCGGAEVDVEVHGQTLHFAVKETGHFQNFVPVTAGRVKLDAGTQTLAVKPRNKKGAAVMDLRRVALLRVRPEKDPGDRKTGEQSERSE